MKPLLIPSSSFPTGTEREKESATYGFRAVPEVARESRIHVTECKLSHILATCVAMGSGHNIIFNTLHAAHHSSGFMNN